MARRLLRDGATVIGADSLAPAFDLRLKEARFAELMRHAAFRPERIDLADEAAARALFQRHRPKRVVHLAAQPGVRLALVQPQPSAASNVVAFLNMLESCRRFAVEHLVYASSSSVYGANGRLPFSEQDPVDHPISLYAATKKSNELMAHSYAHLFGLSVTGLRLFTVYGPWGRPDMAVYAFTDAIAQGRPIQVANGGHVWRDFTYVDDVVEAMARALARPARPNPDWDPRKPEAATSAAPYRVYNVGTGQPEELNRLIAFIEAALGREAVRSDKPLPPGDVAATRADASDLARDLGFAPATPLEEGVRRFVEWYRGYHAR